MCIKAKFSKVKSPYAAGYSPGVTTESYTESPCLKRDWKLQWEVGIYEQLYNDKTTFFFGDFGTNYKMYGIWQQARFHKLVLMLNFQQIQPEMFALWADQWLPAHSSIQILPSFWLYFVMGLNGEKKKKGSSEYAAVGHSLENPISRPKTLSKVEGTSNFP